MFFDWKLLAIAERKLNCGFETRCGVTWNIWDCARFEILSVNEDVGLLIMSPVLKWCC
jgi:hypothetical protein